MITKLSHSSIYVLDQQSARDFYVNQLGFAEKMNVPMGEGVFWITVAPKNQSDFEITLMPMPEGEMGEKLAELVKSGTFGFGVFECEDIYATFQELKEKGVSFTKEPTQEFYGIEAMLKDDSGNWFSLVQRQTQSS